MTDEEIKNHFLSLSFYEQVDLFLKEVISDTKRTETEKEIGKYLFRGEKNPKEILFLIHDLSFFLQDEGLTTLEIENPQFDIEKPIIRATAKARNILLIGGYDKYQKNKANRLILDTEVSNSVKSTNLFQKIGIFSTFIILCIQIYISYNQFKKSEESERIQSIKIDTLTSQLLRLETQKIYLDTLILLYHQKDLPVSALPTKK